MEVKKNVVIPKKIKQWITFIRIELLEFKRDLLVYFWGKHYTHTLNDFYRSLYGSPAEVAGWFLAETGTGQSDRKKR